MLQFYAAIFFGPKSHDRVSICQICHVWGFAETGVHLLSLLKDDAFTVWFSSKTLPWCIQKVFQ